MGGIRQQLLRQRLASARQQGLNNHGDANEGLKRDTFTKVKKSKSITGVIKKHFKKGTFTAADVQEAAEATIRRTGSADPSLQSWFRAGAGGNRRKNICRDIKRSMMRNSSFKGAPPLYGTHGIFWDEDKGEQIRDEMYLQAPHEYIDHLLNTKPIEELIAKPSASTECTEVDRRMHAWARSQNIDPQEPILGFGIWADSAPHTKKDSVYLILIQIITGIYASRMWCTAWAKRAMCACGCNGLHTYERIMEVLTWSAHACRAGMLPLFRDDGGSFEDSKHVGDRWRAKRLTRGRRMKAKSGCGRVIQDWCYAKWAHGSTGWTGEGKKLHCCYLCEANMTDLPYTDFFSNAAWFATIFTHSGFIQWAIGEGKRLPAIFNLPGMRIEFTDIDWMHVMDLGSTQYALGNAMWLLFKKSWVAK